MAASKLWTEAYRPTTLAGYVFRDNNQRAQIEQWIKEKSMPSLIFSGTQGTGKTTLALLLCNELEVNSLDILMMNASRTNSVDDVRNKITNFIQMIPFGDFKVVILDEADFFSCFAANQKIKTVNENGHIVLKSIEELVGCDFQTITYDFKSGDLLVTNATCFQSGEKEVFKVTFDDGSEIFCTEDHPFFNEDGSRATISNGNLFSIN